MGPAVPSTRADGRPRFHTRGTVRRERGEVAGKTARFGPSGRAGDFPALAPRFHRQMGHSLVFSLAQQASGGYSLECSLV